jgi:hypothetical protein
MNPATNAGSPPAARCSTGVRSSKSGCGLCMNTSRTAGVVPGGIAGTITSKPGSSSSPRNCQRGLRRLPWSRQLAEEWTCRFLAAAHTWAITEHAALQRISPSKINITELDQAAAAPQPSTAEVRACARTVGLRVPDRARLHPDIWQAWHDANDPS